MCLSSQPALKVRLAASSKRDGSEWAWVVNVALTAAAVWTERLYVHIDPKKLRNQDPGGLALTAMSQP